MATETDTRPPAETEAQPPAQVENKPRWKRLLEKAMPQISEALPAQVSPERFRQVAATAIGRTPKLLECMETNPQRVLTSLVDCATDGLLPDGRQAALVPFWNKRAKGYDLTYMPMIAGVIKTVRATGEVKTVSARSVYAEDRFDVDYGYPPRIEHKPVFGKPRGAFVAAYAIIEYLNGGIEFDVMDRTEIEKVRMTSKSADSGPWKDWYEGMAEKTVLRRLAKRCSFADPGVSVMLERENAFYDPSRVISGQARPSLRDEFRAAPALAYTQQRPDAHHDEAPARDINEEDETAGEDAPSSEPAQGEAVENPQADLDPADAVDPASSAPSDEDAPFPGDEPASREG